MPTDTIFGDAADNHVRSQDATYATARTGGALAVFASLKVGQDNSGIWCLEPFFAFDTSPLSGVVTSATLSLWLNNDGSTQDFTAECRVKDWSTTVGTEDWVSGADLAALTLVATLASSGVTVSAYNDFTDVALAAAVNLSGFTRLMLNSDRHRLGNAPTASLETLTFADADTAGTVNDPKLTVVSEVVPTAAVTGTGATGLDEAEVRAGGQTIVITLTDSTFIP